MSEVSGGLSTLWDLLLWIIFTLFILSQKEGFLFWESNMTGHESALNMPSNVCYNIAFKKHAVCQSFIFNRKYIRIVSLFNDSFRDLAISHFPHKR